MQRRNDPAFFRRGPGTPSVDPVSARGTCILVSPGASSRRARVAAKDNRDQATGRKFFRNEEKGLECEITACPLFLRWGLDSSAASSAWWGRTGDFSVELIGMRPIRKSGRRNWPLSSSAPKASSRRSFTNADSYFLLARR